MSDIDFAAFENRIFSEEKGVIRIGGEEIKPEFRNVLREQADGLLRSELYEIFQATLYNESARLALQSPSLEAVQYAKALYYLNTSMRKIFTKLAEKG